MTLETRTPAHHPTRAPDSLADLVASASRGLADVDPAAVAAEAAASLYPGARPAEARRAAVLAARARIELDPAYSELAARLLLEGLYEEVLAGPADPAAYRAGLAAYVARGRAADRLDPRLEEFDLARLAAALRPERDRLFTYLGAQTLYDRYLLQDRGVRFELPQYLWLRVAMGLALAEEERDARAIEFYDLLSSLRFTSATPTLFNAGTRHPQLSSCFLTTVPDDLGGIFETLRDNALLSKWAGGLGNDWTPVRALGAEIRGTGGRSQGIVPFLKVANDAAIAVDQGGKRAGAVCAYLEVWHLDVEEFLELRKNTGDERRRTHDMHTAAWIPDLFMERVEAGGQWTLFSPDEVPELHELSGRAFAARYRACEAAADRGEIRLFKRVAALDLWRRMLAALFETGHPWLTWKDAANVRSPQDHVGVVHGSNLCTEILLNTSTDETAVCTLGSVNLGAHVRAGQLDAAGLRATVRTAVRMLDDVVDLNFYPTPAARAASQRHRPVGLGVMGVQDALYALGIGAASPAAVAFADTSTELIAHAAIAASAELARERGPYPSYAGSKWDRGLLPIDTLALLEVERGRPIEVDRSSALDWAPVRAAVRRHGMRNSTVLAIAPTATISNIAGASPSIEPTFQNLYVKSNLSGDFVQVNAALVADLKRLGLWDAAMRDDLKYYDGSVQPIARVPAELKERYRTAFEIDPTVLIAAAARRQKWIDQGQSLNLYLAEPSGRKLDEMYRAAWRAGLKTTYYLRTVAATQVEKSTLDLNRRAIQPRWMKSVSPSSGVVVARAEAPPGPACQRDGDCEACQ